MRGLSMRWLRTRSFSTPGQPRSNSCGCGLSGHSRSRGSSRRRRCGYLRSRPARRALVASLLPLFDLLHLLVDAHRDELDHQVAHPHPALDFAHQLRRRAELHQHVDAFVVLLHTVGEFAHAPLVGLLDRSLAGTDHLLDLFHKAVDLLFRSVRLNDKQLFVDSHSSSVFKPPARRLNAVMDFSTPSASMDSTAAAPRPATSSTSFFCARLNRASTNFAPSPTSWSG